MTDTESDQHPSDEGETADQRPADEGETLNQRLAGDGETLEQRLADEVEPLDQRPAGEVETLGQRLAGEGETPEDRPSGEGETSDSGAAAAATLTVGEAAQRSGLSARVIHHAIQSGELPVCEIARDTRREYRITPQSLDHFAAGYAARARHGAQDGEQDGADRSGSSGPHRRHNAGESRAREAMAPLGGLLIVLVFIGLAAAGMAVHADHMTTLDTALHHHHLSTLDAAPRRHLSPGRGPQRAPPRHRR